MNSFTGNWPLCLHVTPWSTLDPLYPCTCSFNHGVVSYSMCFNFTSPLRLHLLLELLPHSWSAFAFALYLNFPHWPAFTDHLNFTCPLAYTCPIIFTCLLLALVLWSALAPWLTLASWPALAHDLHLPLDPDLSSDMYLSSDLYFDHGTARMRSVVL